MSLKSELEFREKSGAINWYQFGPTRGGSFRSSWKDRLKFIF